MQAQAYRLPDQFNPRGDYYLGLALRAIDDQWRRGRQIVLVVGAGLSVEAGFPAVSALTEHLLVLRFLRALRVGLRLGGEPNVRHPAFDPAIDGWVAPSSVSHYLPSGLHKFEVPQLSVRYRLVLPFLAASLKEDADRFVKHLTQNGSKQVIDFAREALGLGWLSLIPEAADHNPALAEALFDALGRHVRPGTTHAVLAQCVSWFNVDLILTTNFDTLIEDSLAEAGMRHYAYDIHASAPAPPSTLVRQHLSVIKLHGSRYGIRADQTVQMPMARGDVHEILDYLDGDALLIVLGYGGNDRRVMDVFRQLLASRSHAECCVIRVDPAVPHPTHPFGRLAASVGTLKRGSIALPRVLNLYYPESGSFLLDMFQHCAAAMPNSRYGYLPLPHNPAPYREYPALGRDANRRECESSDNPPEIDRHHQKEVSDLLEDIQRYQSDPATAGRTHVTIVTGPPHCGVSQFLAQVLERLGLAYETRWCDLEEATSVGTLVMWLDQFAHARQPDLPHPPPPLDLPVVDCPGDLSTRELISLDRTAAALVHRLTRMRALILLDSVDACLVHWCRPASGERQRREAVRLVVFLCIMLRRFQESTAESQAVILIGVHAPPKEDPDVRGLASLFGECKRVILRPDAPWGDRDRPGLMTALNCLIGIRLNNRFRVDGTAVRRMLRNQHYPVPRCVGETGDWDGTLMQLPSVDPADGFGYTLQAAEGHGIASVADRPAADPPTWLEADEAVRCIRSQDTPEWRRLTDLLVECSLARRPRSLALLYALPSAEKTPLQPHDQAEIIRLVEAALLRGLLRREPGGYFWMDSALKGSLQANDAVPKHMARRAHDKYRRYYERLFDQSGDVSCLNEFVYHSLQRADLAEGDDALQILFEAAVCLRDNAWAARSNPGVYDYAFLCLCIYDHLAKRAPYESHAADRAADFLRALTECYEDAEDADGVSAIARRSDRIPFGEEFQHQEQKNLARRLDVNGALELGRKLIEGMATSMSGDPGAASILTGSDTAKRGQLVRALASHPLPRQVLFHRTLLRYQRHLSRSVWACAGVAADEALECELERRATSLQELERINSFGMELLASAGAPDGYDAKKLWVRYRTNRAEYYVTGMDRARYEERGMNKVLWQVRQARAFAGSGAGTDGAFYEAVTWIHEAEALLWEGRYLLARVVEPGTQGPVPFDEVRARQDSALFAVQQCLHTLTRCRRALVWWRESTVLRVAVGADMLKRLICELIQHGAGDPVQGTRAALRAEGDRGGGFTAALLHAAGRMAEQTARELTYLRHVVDGEAWRRTQLVFECSRLRFYVLGLISLFIAAAKGTEHVAPGGVRALLALLRTLRVLDEGRGVPYVRLILDNGVDPVTDAQADFQDLQELAEQLHAVYDTAEDDWVLPDPQLPGPLAENVTRMRAVLRRALESTPLGSLRYEQGADPAWIVLARRQADRAGADYF
jgi:hypothetical protein